MAQFTWEGKTRGGESRSGVLEAKSVAEVEQRIRAMGLRILERALLARGTAVRHDPDRLAETVYYAFRRWRAPAARNRGGGGSDLS